MHYNWSLTDAFFIDSLSLFIKENLIFKLWKHVCKWYFSGRERLSLLRNRCSIEINRKIMKNSWFWTSIPTQWVCQLSSADDNSYRQDYDFFTLQEHQRNLTNATLSKDSDFSVLMVVYEIMFLHFSSKSKKSINSLPT